MQIPDSHFSRQIFISFLPGAVAGVESGIIFFQFFCDPVKDFFWNCFSCGRDIQMKSSDTYLGFPSGSFFHNIYHSFMAAAHDQYGDRAVDQEILLVGESILSLLIQKHVIGLGMAFFFSCHRKKLQLLVDLKIPLQQCDPGISGQLRIQANASGLSQGSGIIGGEGRFLYVDPGLGIHMQKFFQSPSMIVMAMGNDRRIYFFQINIHFFRILKKSMVRPQIKEQPVTRGLYIKRKPVGGLTLTHGLIFYQHNCFHHISLSSFYFLVMYP